MFYYDSAEAQTKTDTQQRSRQNNKKAEAIMPQLINQTNIINAYGYYAIPPINKYMIIIIIIILNIYNK